MTSRSLTVDRFSIKTKAYKKDAFHNRIISLQVLKMLTTRQLQLLRLQRVNQNAAIAAMMVYRRLIRRRRRQYWLRPWIARRPQLGDYENLMERESHALALALRPGLRR